MDWTRAKLTRDLTFFETQDFDHSRSLNPSEKIEVEGGSEDFAKNKCIIGLLDK